MAKASKRRTRRGPFKPVDIYRAAEQCEFACIAIQKGINKGEPVVSAKFQTVRDAPDMTVPLVFLMAFTLELYLKCLKAIQTKRHLQSHDLRKLYLNLSPADRTTVKKYAEEYEPH